MDNLHESWSAREKNDRCESTTLQKVHVWSVFSLTTTSSYLCLWENQRELQLNIVNRSVRWVQSQSANNFPSNQSLVKLKDNIWGTLFQTRRSLKSLIQISFSLLLRQYYRLTIIRAGAENIYFLKLRLNLSVEQIAQAFRRENIFIENIYEFTSALVCSVDLSFHLLTILRCQGTIFD